MLFGAPAGERQDALGSRLVLDSLKTYAACSDLNHCSASKVSGEQAVMKVLHLIPSFVGGGAERQLALLAPELCRMGVTTHIGFAHPGITLEPLRDTQVKLHKVACSGNHDPAILLRLLKIVRSIRPHIVQTWLLQMDVFGGTAAKLARVPFVLSERSSAIAYPTSWKNRLRELIGRKATAIVANSEGGVNYWRSKVHPHMLHVIRNGIPLERIRAAVPADASSVGLPRDIRLILFAGRLSPEKNIENFLEALGPVLESYPDCGALIFGEGPLRDSVFTRIECMRSRARVCLLGFTSDLWRWMRRATMFVSLSHFEGNPNTVLEAMAAGCALVASDIPGHREILDERMAKLCIATSVPSISYAIRSVLEDPGDAATRAAAAYARASTWSIEGAARQYTQLYESLMAPREVHA